MVTVLVAEDDAAVARSVERALRFEGFEVRVAGDGEEALAAAGRGSDVIVLDIMMPRLDGLEVCRRLRARGDTTPILMLTARHQVTDRVAGLDAGADDYLVKPFALDELLARLRALVRRTTPGDRGDPVRVGDVVLDPAGRTVHRGERRIDLTKTEFDLLALLMSEPGIVFSRERIYEQVWGIDFETTSNSLDVYIGYLRRKTEAEGEPRLVQTVRGVGYVVRAE